MLSDHIIDLDGITTKFTTSWEKRFLKLLLIRVKS